MPVLILRKDRLEAREAFRTIRYVVITGVLRDS